MSEVHAQARTTPRTRAEIKNSTASLLELAKRYNISVATARKWKQRDSPEDLSHRPHKLCTTLTPAQEAIAVAVRSLTLLGLDDLVAVVREFINPDVSRSGLDRCLRRHGVANLRQLQAQALADAGQVEPQVKTFKDYEPGFLHMDIKYLPRMPDEKQRRYLFVAIDRATRWVFMHIYADQSEQSSVDFLNRLERAAPMKIVKLLTDNGSQFTDRFTSKKREPTGCHDFDVRCGELGIEHRLCPPRHPQTNGMVERFNGRISEVVKQTRFASAAELETTLERYVKTYNQLIPQRALNHLSPIQALKEWQKKKPKLFKKRVYNQPGLDIFLIPDVLSDHFLIPPHCRDKIPSRPKTLSHKVAPALSVHSGNVDRTLPFHVPHHLRHRMLWRNRNQHVNMIRHQMPFQNLALLALRQLSEHLSQVLAQARIQRLPSALRNEHHMVFALPPTVA